jgi:hypothetical protein
VDRLTVEVEGRGGSTGKDEVEVDRNKSKVEVVDWVKSKSKVEVVRHGKDIDNKSKRSTDKRSTGGRVETTEDRMKVDW